MESLEFRPLRIDADRILQFRPGPTPGIGIVRDGTGYRLVTAQAFAEGARLFGLNGRSGPQPTRYSVQVGRDEHLDPGSWCDAEEIVRCFFWRFMNHSCAPAVRIRDREVLAIRAIAPWEDVTFDYNTTEFDLTEPFLCRCGAPACLGEIRGFRYLTSAQRGARAPLLAPHLLDLADLPAATPSGS